MKYEIELIRINLARVRFIVKIDILLWPRNITKLGINPGYKSGGNNTINPFQLYLRVHRLFSY